LTDVCYMAFPLQVWCNCYAKIFCWWYMFESVSMKIIILLLGPSLFFFYINDMPDDIKSTVRLFADDTIVYLSVLRWQHTPRSSILINVKCLPLQRRKRR
jgi:hypothetical protein